MAYRSSKLGPNSGPKLGANLGPKLGSNTGPKLGANTGPKLGSNTGPKLRPSSGSLGIDGAPIGKGIHGTQPKMDNPCNMFRNTGNAERVGNTERRVNVEAAANTEKTFTFKSNNDILKLLKYHPDFERVPPDSLQPIVAAILSGR